MVSIIKITWDHFWEEINHCDKHTVSTICPSYEAAFGVDAISFWCLIAVARWRYVPGLAGGGRFTKTGTIIGIRGFTYICPLTVPIPKCGRTWFCKIKGLNLIFHYETRIQIFLPEPVLGGLTPEHWYIVLIKSTSELVRILLGFRRSQLLGFFAVMVRPPVLKKVSL